MHPLATPAPKVAAIQWRYLNTADSLSEIARLEQVGRTTVVKCVKPLPRRQPGNHVNTKTVDEAKTLLASGQPLKAVARKLGVSATTIRKHVVASGEPPRRRGRPRKTAANIAR